MKSMDIKGKEYIPVNERIKEFWKLHPDWSIVTEISNREGREIEFRAIVSDETGRIRATGTAYEKEGSSFINKTSYVENCETSAIGRALGILGIGIDTSVASYEEIGNSQLQQKATNKTEALKAYINLSVPEMEARVLKKYGVNYIEDMTEEQLDEAIKAFEQAQKKKGK